jgi:hypothetical protein
MADFTGDGYADLIVHNISGGLRIASARDVTDMSAGLTWGSEVQATIPSDCPNFNLPGQCSAFAVGDFRGDGQHEIAMVGVGGNDSGLALIIYVVDSDTLAITQASSATLAIPDASALFLIPFLAAGRFGTTLHDQLVLVYGSGGGTNVNDQVVAIDFDATLQPTVKGTLNLFPRVAVNRSTAFIGEVEVQRGTGLTDQQVDRLIGQAKQIIGCV